MVDPLPAEGIDLTSYEALSHWCVSADTESPSADAGAELLNDFVIGGNRLGLPWDGDCGGVGPAFGCWNVYVEGRGSNWESLWACLASFKEDLDGYAGFVCRVAVRMCRKMPS